MVTNDNFDKLEISMKDIKNAKKFYKIFKAGEEDIEKSDIKTHYKIFHTICKSLKNKLKN